jgi:hypothetical protein
MQRQRLGCARARLVKGRAGRSAAWEIGERHAVVAIGVLVDQRDIVGDGSWLSLRPACFSMERFLPMGMSVFGWAIVMRPGLVGCLN